MILPGGFGAADRSQSSVIGVVLIIALVIATTAIVVALGASAITSAQDNADINQVQKVMTELDSRGALVALQGADQQQIELPSSNQKNYRLEADAGWMKIEDSDGNIFLDKQPLGKLVYEAEGNTIAYQGGGVWLGQEGGTTMISPPEFHYRGKTLTVPLIKLDTNSDRSISGRVSITSTGQVPLASEPPKPLFDRNVIVTVKSDYAKGWGAYFETRTDGKVTYPAEDKVRLKLKADATPRTVSGGIVSGASADELKLNPDAEVDSYDSRDGPYSTSVSSDTTVYVAGDLDMRSDTKIWGDAVVGGSWDLDSSAEVTGTLRNGDVPQPTPVNDKINDKSNFAGASNNDNDDHPTVITALETGSATIGTLEAGNYYLSEMELDGSTDLTLDTTDGQVDIYVDESFVASSGSRIEVTGGSRASVYVNGNAGGKEVELKNGATITTGPDDDARQFWLFMKKNAKAQINNDVLFKGVIYGPGGTSSDGARIKLQPGGGSEAQIYGAVVGYVPGLRPGKNIHFDQALTSTEVFKQESSIPPIQYLHVTVNRIKLDS